MFLTFLAVAAPFHRVLVLPLVSLLISIYFLILEVIIDYGSAFVTYGNEIESKGVQFPGRSGPDKISGGGYSAVAPDTSKICGFVLQEPQDYDSL